MDPTFGVIIDAVKNIFGCEKVLKLIFIRFWKVLIFIVDDLTNELVTKNKKKN